jgi:hypothetical protein
MIGVEDKASSPVGCDKLMYRQCSCGADWNLSLLSSLLQIDEAPPQLAQVAAAAPQQQQQPQAASPFPWRR